VKLVFAAVLAASAHAGAAAAPTAPAGRDDLSAEDLKRVLAITAPTRDFSKAETFETMQAGATTTNKLINADIFSQPSANMSFERRQEFQVGNGLFRKDWVSAPASTQASDGLGPLFNARSCQACHTKDGRGSVPGFDPLERPDAVALLLRLAVPEGPDRGHPRLAPGEIALLPEPVYGVQLQNFAVAGLPAEGRMEIEYTPVTVKLNGGETATLMKPTYRIDNLGYGPMRKDTQISPRLAPPMIGLGLLESIHEADILANIGADKRDGIVGKANWVTDARTGQRAGPLQSEGRPAHGGAAERRRVFQRHGAVDAAVPQPLRRLYAGAAPVPADAARRAAAFRSRGSAGQADGLRHHLFHQPGGAAAARCRRRPRAGRQETVLRGQLRGLPRAQVRHQPQREAGRASLPADLAVHRHAGARHGR